MTEAWWQRILLHGKRGFVSGDRPQMGTVPKRKSLVHHSSVLTPVGSAGGKEIRNKTGGYSDFFFPPNKRIGQDT